MTALLILLGAALGFAGTVIGQWVANRQIRLARAACDTRDEEPAKERQRQERREVYMSLIAAGHRFSDAAKEGSAAGLADLRRAAAIVTLERPSGPVRERLDHATAAAERLATLRRGGAPANTAQEAIRDFDDALRALIQVMSDDITPD